VSSSACRTGYAVTSHVRARARRFDRVLINLDTTRSRELANRQHFYVSLSRARHDALIFTDSREELPRAISRTSDKATALNISCPAGVSAAGYAGH
jgi:hypothetical protein